MKPYSAGAYESGRQDTGTDDARVRVRAQKGSRPRTKRRPDYSEAPLGRVVAIDRGRFTVALPSGLQIHCIKARELGRRGIVMGDLVRLSGDLSGKPGVLARIVQIEPRQHVLRRSLEEVSDARGEKIIVAGADQLVVVVAAADPPPRAGMVERCLVAAREAEIPALLCITKADLTDPTPFLAQFAGFELEVVETAVGDVSPGLDAPSEEVRADEAGAPASSESPVSPTLPESPASPGDSAPAPGIDELTDHLAGQFSVLVGHSGVGKSTLINALVPSAGRAVGAVSQLTGKGRHTSTSAQAFELPGGGWVVDTPGVRSFGLSHVTAEDVLGTFPGLLPVTGYCLPNCEHSADEPSCALDAWARREPPFDTPDPPEGRADLVARARTLLPTS